MNAEPPLYPYKYFAYFEEKDRDIFFGRRREIETLLADIVTTRLVVLFARSGTGKSSLINAGVRPRLRDRDYRTLIARVGNDPVTSVEKAAADEELKVPPSTRSLAALLTGIVEREKRPLVLFLDQFEEFFLNDITDETRRAFVADVGRLYRTKDGGVHLVFSMREDYLAELDALRDEIPAIFEKESQLRLRLLSDEQAKEAIEGPAGVVAAPFEFDAGLVDRIVRDLPREQGLIQPVAVQIVCTTLWDEKKPASKITQDLYEVLGKASGIIEARVAKDIAEYLNADQILMLELAIDLMHTKDWTKRSVSESELMTKTQADLTAMRALMTALDSSGLARVDSRGSGGSEWRIEWVSDYISELSRDMRPSLRRIWLRSPGGDISRERTIDLLNDSVFLRMLDEGAWYGLLRAASATRDTLGQWRRAAEALGFDPWPLIERALSDSRTGEENAARLIQYLGEENGGRPFDILVRQLKKPTRLRTALRALGAVRDPKAIDAIRPFLDQEEWQIAALDALRTIATPEALKLADSVQKRGRSIGDFVPFMRPSELRGMDEEGWSLLGIDGLTGVIGPTLSSEAMLKRLTERFEYPFSEATDIRTVMEYLSVTFGTGWQKLLLEGSSEIPKSYQALATLPVNTWLTTDYTEEFERALMHEGKDAVVGTPIEFTLRPDRETSVIHMLGFIGKPTSISEGPRTVALIEGITDSLFQLDPKSLIVFGFDRTDPEVSVMRYEFGLRKESIPTFLIAPPPSLHSRRQHNRAQEYFQQYSRTRGVHFYWGTPEEFVDEFHKRFSKA